MWQAKINAQKSVAFLYTNNETEEREIKESVNPIYNCTQKHKIPRNKPNQEVKNLYPKNYRTLLKAMRKTQRDGKIFHGHGLAELIL